MESFKNIGQIKLKVEDFLKSIKRLSGKGIDAPIFKEPINAACFPDEIDKKLGEDRGGVYLFWAEGELEKFEVLYIGMSKDITNRFYSHIGTQYSWDRPGSKALFPNNFAMEYNWVSENIKDIIRNGKFQVSAIIIRDIALSCLIESFLIFLLELKINIIGKREDSFIPCDK